MQIGLSMWGYFGTEFLETIAALNFGDFPLREGELA